MEYMKLYKRLTLKQKLTMCELDLTPKEQIEWMRKVVGCEV